MGALFRCGNSVAGESKSPSLCLVCGEIVCSKVIIHALNIHACVNASIPQCLSGVHFASPIKHLKSLWDDVC